MEFNYIDKKQKDRAIVSQIIRSTDKHNDFNFMSLRLHLHDFLSHLFLDTSLWPTPLVVIPRVVHSCPQLSTVVRAPKYGSVRVVRAPSALRLQSGVTPLPWSRVRATLYSCGGAAAGRVPRRTVHAGRSSVRHSAAPHQSFKQIFAKISQSQIRDQAPTIGPSPG